MATKKPVLAFGGIPTVNLLPRVEVDRRERIALTRTWALGALAAVVVTALVIGGAFAFKVVADNTLAGERARTDLLLTNLAEYSDISRTISTSNSLEAFRSDAMQRDFAWAPLIEEVTKRLADGVVIVEVSLEPHADPAIAAGIPVDKVGVSGTMTFSGPVAGSQAATVAALRDLPGIISVDAGTLTSIGEDSVEFSVALIYDTSVFSGDYAQEGGK